MIRISAAPHGSANAVVASAVIAIDQHVTATLRPHMAQSHRCQFPNFGRRHVSQFALPSASGQHRRRASSWARPARGLPGNALLTSVRSAPLSSTDSAERMWIRPRNNRMALTATMRLP
jgi:hypothetical protein